MRPKWLIPQTNNQLTSSIFLKIKNRNISTCLFVPSCLCLSSNVTLTYCPTLDRISVSGPIWRMLSCSQHGLWHSIPAPDPTSHCSDRTSSARYLYTAAPPSSAPAVLCCPQHCPRSWERQKKRPTKIRGWLSWIPSQVGTISTEGVNSKIHSSPCSVPLQATNPSLHKLLVRSSYIFVLFLFPSPFSIPFCL